MLPVDTHEVHGGVCIGRLFAGTLAECRSFVAREIRAARQRRDAGHYGGATLIDRGEAWDIVVRPHMLLCGRPISERVQLEPIARPECGECGCSDSYVFVGGEDVCSCRVCPDCEGVDGCSCCDEEEEG